jgi:hypothetical protein
MIRFNFLINVKMPCGQTRQPTSSSTLSTSSTQRPTGTTGNNLFNGLMGWLNNYIGQGTTSSGSTQPIQSNQSEQSTAGSSCQRRRSTQSSKSPKSPRSSKSPRSPKSPRSTQTYSTRPTRRQYDGVETPTPPPQEWRVPPNYDDYGFDGLEGSDGSESRRRLNLSDSERERRRQRAKKMLRDPVTGRFISPRRQR